MQELSLATPGLAGCCQAGAGRVQAHPSPAHTVHCVLTGTWLLPDFVLT